MTLNRARKDYKGIQVKTLSTQVFHNFLTDLKTNVTEFELARTYRSSDITIEISLRKGFSP